MEYGIRQEMEMLWWCLSVVRACYYVATRSVKCCLIECRVIEDTGRAFLAVTDISRSRENVARLQKNRRYFFPKMP